MGGAQHRHVRRRPDAARSSASERRSTSARRVGDADLEFVALAYLGASLVHDDRTEEGMVLLDEALAAVAGSEVDDFFVLEEIFCQLFAACEHAHDVARADQWIRVGEAIAARRKLPAVSAFCRTHYGGVLTAAGRWPEADVALTEAVRLWGLGHRSLRGGALVRLADLRVRQGRFEEAEQLLDGLEGDVDAARPRRRHPPGARRDVAAPPTSSSGRWASSTRASTAAAPLLAAAGRRPPRRRPARRGRGHRATRWTACAARHAEPLPGRRRPRWPAGRLCLAAGDRRSAGLPARGARRLRPGADADGGRARPARAGQRRSLAERPEVAMAEARAALDAFERLRRGAPRRRRRRGAAHARGPRHVGRRSGAGSLTKREAEVLELLGHGLSNPEISDRLYISRKTVEHHVGNILAKLGLRSRAEAAAYATRTKPADE